MAFDLGNCTDVFSANGPTYYGGTGDLGICYGDGFWNRMFHDGNVRSAGIAAQIGNGTYISPFPQVYERVPSISKSWGQGGPAGGGTNFMTTVTAVTLGWWEAPATGEYTIYCKWDDNVLLSFDGGQTADWDQGYISHAWISFTKNFVAGVRYPILTMVYEAAGHFEIQLKYSLPGDPILPLNNNIITDGHEFEAAIWADSVEYSETSIFQEFFPTNYEFGVPGVDVINNPSVSTTYDAYSGIDVPPESFSSQCIDESIQISRGGVWSAIDENYYLNEPWEFITDLGYATPNCDDVLEEIAWYTPPTSNEYNYFRIKCTQPVLHFNEEDNTAFIIIEESPDYILWDNGGTAQQQCQQEFSIEYNTNKFWNQDLDKRPAGLNESGPNDES